ncbi:MAG TPA: 2-oxoglutarate and iron-dependent oxygenase domain-containing protein [Polyangia bacterium]
MSFPVLSVDDLAPVEVARAFREGGGVLLSFAIDGQLCAEVLQAAHRLFSLPREEKQAIAIEKSPHFRGWSEMHNQRDWREQIHLGRDLPAAGEEPPHRRLQGPNLWPADPHWRSVVSAYMDAAAMVGERILASAAAGLGVPGTPFAGVGREGYVLLKQIGYHPQASVQQQRPGVAAHVDFSWITLTLQDSPGLEVKSPDGHWTLIPPVPGALWVHAGELLEVASRGVYAATPHRVVNPSLDRTRVSLPLFLNPPLEGWVAPFVDKAAGGGGVGKGASTPSKSPSSSEPQEHIHRVLPEGTSIPRFHFGEAEWRRKGRNGWCYRCAPATGD